MTNVKPQSKWAVARTWRLALPFLALTAVALPQAYADDHYGRLHHEIREDYRHGDYEGARADRHELHRRKRHDGYYHGGRYYRHRSYYYRGGHRYYRYDGLYPSGVNVNIAL